MLTPVAILLSAAALLSVALVLCLAATDIRDRENDINGASDCKECWKNG